MKKYFGGDVDFSMIPDGPTKKELEMIEAEK
jgi:hypothetical protein